MKITQDVREYAEKLGVETGFALKKGMPARTCRFDTGGEEEAKEFAEKGSEIYIKEE